MFDHKLLSFILGATALSSPVAFAADVHQSQLGPTRQQVVQETIEAARNGSLVPAGEFIGMLGRPQATGSTSRAQVKDQTLTARATGELQRPGEAPLHVVAALSGSDRTRQEVRAETLAARVSGTLVPAGELNPAQQRLRAEPHHGPMTAQAPR